MSREQRDRRLRLLRNQAHERFRERFIEVDWRAVAAERGDQLRWVGVLAVIGWAGFVACLLGVI